MRDCDIVENMSEDLDPVVFEADVYLSKPTHNQFYLLQNPLKPKNLHDIHANLKTAKFKKNSKKLFLDYDTSQNSSKNKVNENDHCVNSIKYTCSNVLANPDLFCVGFYEEGKLYLVPLEGILEAKPDVATTTTYSNTPELQSQNSEYPIDEQSKKISLNKIESEDLRNLRVRSFDYVRNLIKQEPWMDLQILNHTNPKLLYFIHYLTKYSRENSFSDFMMPSKDYLSRILIGACASDKFISDIQMIEDKDAVILAKNYFLYANCYKYSDLNSLTPAPDKRRIILDLAVHSSVLVQGCLFIKSEILYQSSLGCLENIELLYACAARDFILWSFAENRTVSYEYLMQNLNIPFTILSEILESIAVKADETTWNFCAEPDIIFLQECDENIVTMSKDWDSIIKNFTKVLDLQFEIPNITEIYRILKCPQSDDSSS